MAGSTRRFSKSALLIFDKATDDIQAEFIKQAEAAKINISLDGRSRNLPSSKDTSEFLLNNKLPVTEFVSQELIPRAAAV